MTPKEHELMQLMFARMYEHFGNVIEILQSREILTGDDPKAFYHATHADQLKLAKYLLQAQKDYQGLAKACGVELGPWSEGPQTS